MGGFSLWQPKQGDPGYTWHPLFSVLPPWPAPNSFPPNIVTLSTFLPFPPLPGKKGFRKGVGAHRGDLQTWKHPGLHTQLFSWMLPRGRDGFSLTCRAQTKQQWEKLLERTPEAWQTGTSYRACPKIIIVVLLLLFWFWNLVLFRTYSNLCTQGSCLVGHWGTICDGWLGVRQVLLPLSYPSAPVFISVIDRFPQNAKLRVQHNNS